MYFKYEYPELFEGVPRTDFKKLSGKITIYGAGFQGLLTAFLLKKQGIEVLCFCDRDPEKQGTLYYGVPVYAPQEMKQKYPDATVVVTPYNLEPAYQYVIDELKYTSVVTPFSLFLEFDFDGFDDLTELPSWYNQGCLGFHVTTFLLKCVNLLTTHYLWSTDIAVTEVCNLRCKHCTSLNPCYKTPKHFTLEEVLHEVDTILEGRTFHHIFLEGGEVFLWKPLAELLEKMCQYPNLMNVWIITNGTIIPDENLLRVLKHPKILVRISDYGKLSKVETLRKIFEDNHIQYTVLLPKWFELSAFHRVPHSKTKLIEVVSDCCKLGGRGAQHIANGVLYRCPIQANLHRLGIFVSPPSDYVDLRNPNKIELQEQISDFFCNRKIIQLCHYCDGRGYSNIEVVPAEQLLPGESIQVRFE